MKRLQESAWSASRIPTFSTGARKAARSREMAYVEQVSFNLAGAAVTQPENIQGDSVSPNFLSMMGVRPLLGRDFEPVEGNSGTQRVLLLGYSALAVALRR